MEMTRSAFEMYQAVRAASDEHNDPVIYVESSEDLDSPVERMTISVARPDVLLDETDIGPNELLRKREVGHPDKVFVHAGDVARYSGCSLETARNWLKKFESRGLIKHHGTGDAEVGTVALYRPVLEDQVDINTKLYELEGRRPPDHLVATETVTPGQFEHIGGSRFKYEDDESVTIDVSKPENSTTIQEHVNSQLRQHGLIPSSPKNFTYDLRKEAGLV